MGYTVTFSVPTEGRGTTDITRQVEQVVADAGIDQGLCSVFVQHTSASLIICENADPDVRTDLESWFGQLVKDGDPMFLHSSEGPDDMSGHIRSILSQPSISIPISGGKCTLGTWQGIYLWEHRTRAHSRKVSVSVVG